MIVGGRDAKGNDTVVRKYLRSTDLYVHADLHGAHLAPSDYTMG